MFSETVKPLVPSPLSKTIPPAPSASVIVFLLIVEVPVTPQGSIATAPPVNSLSSKLISDTKGAQIPMSPDPREKLL